MKTIYQDGPLMVQEDKGIAAITYKRDNGNHEVVVLTKEQLVEIAKLVVKG
jgi:hypothetical protein